MKADGPWVTKTLNEMEDQIRVLKSENKNLRSRVAALEYGLEGIANCAFDYSPKSQTATQAAEWMNNEAMRLLTN